MDTTVTLLSESNPINLPTALSASLSLSQFSSNYSVIMDTTEYLDGLRFHPTDQELIWRHLYRKANGIPLTSSAIIDCDIYGDVSSWRNMFEDREENSLYFFNRLAHKNGSSSRVGRATEFGTWKCQSDTKIYVGQFHVGSKRAFSFIEKKTEEEPLKKVSKKTSGWTMQEYRLDGILMHHNQQHSYVISKISRPRHMLRHEGQFSTSLIECELQALVNAEQVQGNNKFENFEMDLDCNLGTDLDYDCLYDFLEENDPASSHIFKNILCKFR